MNPGLPPNTIGQLGTAGRNILVGPPERNWDFSLVKDTKLGFLGEAGMVEFRAEFFNVMNHPNFAGGSTFKVQIFPSSPADTGPFSEVPSNGHSTQQVQDGQREIQFALRFELLESLQKSRGLRGRNARRSLRERRNLEPLRRRTRAHKYRDSILIRHRTPSGSWVNDFPFSLCFSHFLLIRPSRRCVYRSPHALSAARPA